MIKVNKIFKNRLNTNKSLKERYYSSVDHIGFYPRCKIIYNLDDIIITLHDLSNVYRLLYKFHNYRDIGYNLTYTLYDNKQRYYLYSLHKIKLNGIS